MINLNSRTIHRQSNRKAYGIMKWLVRNRFCEILPSNSGLKAVDPNQYRNVLIRYAKYIDPDFDPSIFENPISEIERFIDKNFGKFRKFCESNLFSK